MATKTRVKFNKKALARQMYNNIANEQTERLIAYAQKEIVRLVEMNLTNKFKNRTYNLQDSYVWAVYYKGKKAKHGFYGNKVAESKSILHEYSPSISVDVNGRALARKFVDQLYKPTETQGWEIVFAACAPYGAYLEGGFMFHGKRYQFDVMSQRYDHIKQALSPLCRVRFEVNQPKY
jgi:hypothetical protein